MPKHTTHLPSDSRPSAAACTSPKCLITRDLSLNCRRPTGGSFRFLQPHAVSPAVQGKGTLVLLPRTSFILKWVRPPNSHHTFLDAAWLSHAVSAAAYIKRLTVFCDLAGIPVRHEHHEESSRTWNIRCSLKSPLALKLISSFNLWPPTSLKDEQYTLQRVTEGGKKRE